MKLILASKSPRRIELLKDYYKKDFKIIPSSYDESNIKKVMDDPISLTLALAANKGLAIVDNVDEDDIIISSDTVVFIKEKGILGKPKDHKEAKEFLTLLNNKEHQVITSYTFIRNKEIIFQRYKTSNLFIEKMSQQEIDLYIKTESPMDKAGAYGVQDKEYIHTKKISIEDEHNIMGFPIEIIIKDLEQFI